MSVCVHICVLIYMCVCVCVCVWARMRVSFCACVYLYVCVCARSRVCVCLHLYIDECVCVYACMLAPNCCVCIGHTSPSSSVRLHIQSSPCTSPCIRIFNRWLTAVHVNNNNCNALIAIRNNIRHCTLTEGGDKKLIFYFWIPQEHSGTNEWKNFTTYIFTVKLKGNARGAFFRRSMVINTLGDDCLLRMRAQFFHFS